MITIDQQTLDRHHQQSPSSLTQPRQVQLRASPGLGSDIKSMTATNTRYAPYPVPKTPPYSAQRQSLTLQRHFDPLSRPSAPIDIHRPHRSTLSMETDTESLYFHSPGTFFLSRHFLASTPASYPTHQRRLNTDSLLTGYPSLSVPAPSVDSSDTSDDELEENDFDGYGHTLDVPFNAGGGPPRDYSLRTPVHLPSSLPSPRVMHAPSSSIPTGGLPPISTIGVGIGPNGSFSPPTKAIPYASPARNPITLPTTTGGTYTFEPLPVILGPQPNRDSSWRWNYYDKVSSMRHTLSDKLYHKEPTKPTMTLNRNFDDESEEEDGVLSDAPSASPSPNVKPARLEEGGVLDRLGGLFVGGGKKQFFATPTTYSAFSKAG